MTRAETHEQRQQLAFWLALKKRLDERKNPFRATKPRSQQNWMERRIGPPGFVWGIWRQSTEKWIGVYLEMVDHNVTAHFGLLQQQREEIEQELGRLEWQPLPDNKKSRILLRKNADPMQQEDWSNQIDWMASTLVDFNKTFSPRLKCLNASDWQTP